MPTNTYVALDKITVGSAVSSVDFNAISQAYTDLVIVCSARYTSTNVGQGIGIRFNGDSTTNYSATILEGDGATASSYRGTSLTRGLAGAVANGSQTSFAPSIIYVQNYANATNFKTYLVRQSGPTYVQGIVGLWRKAPEAITSISIIADSTAGNIAVGSTFSLYGIKAEAVVNPTAKATGGTITYDSFGNVIHTFTSSGTFTPTATIANAEYLVLAGGGAGGVNQGGGGGAGGYRSSVVGELSGGGANAQTRVNFANGTGYTVTVGAGGAGGFNSTPIQGASGNSSSISGSGFTTISTTGGGGGGGFGFNGANGGSGGGRGGSNSPGTGTANEGFNGVVNAGGGAGNVGLNNVGGDGLRSSITGASVGRAGGSSYTGATAFGAGTTGVSQPAMSGEANKGGGGAPWDGTYNSGSGGSGVVIIRYSGI